MPTRHGEAPFQTLRFMSTRTFFTVLPFVSRITDARSHNARAVSAAGDVDALVGWNVAFGPFPATVAHAATFEILTVSTAQHWTGRWRHTNTKELKEDSQT